MTFLFFLLNELLELKNWFFFSEIFLKPKKKKIKTLKPIAEKNKPSKKNKSKRINSKKVKSKKN